MQSRRLYPSVASPPTVLVIPMRSHELRNVELVGRCSPEKNEDKNVGPIFKKIVDNIYKNTL